MSNNTERKLVAARNEMMERFGLSGRDAEIMALIGAATAVELAPLMEQHGYECTVKRQELLDILADCVRRNER